MISWSRKSKFQKYCKENDKIRPASLAGSYEDRALSQKQEVLILTGTANIQIKI